MKKYSSLFFLACSFFAGAFLFSSCGRLFQRAKEPVSVYAPGMPGTAPMLKTLCENFTRKTQIPVEWQTSLTKETDAVISDANTLLEFTKIHPLEPMDDTLTQEQQKDFFPEALSAPPAGSMALFAPFAARAWALIYNQDMLRKAGYNAPPDTWDAFVNEAANVKAKHISGAPVVWAWKDKKELVNAFTALTFSFGGKLFDEKGNPSFQEEQGLFGLVLMKESLGRITDPASFTTDSGAALKSYMEGKSAMFFGWHTWNAAANGGEKSKIKGHSRFAPVPGMTGSQRTALLDTASIGILSSAPHKENAIKLSQYLLSAEAQREVMARFGWFSTTRSLYEDPELLEMLPLLPHYKEIMELAKSIHTPDGNEKFAAVLSPEILLALLGKKNLKQALDDAAAQLKTMTKAPAS